MTEVELCWQEGVREHWLRFGKPADGWICSRTRRIEAFAPEQIFALVRWSDGPFGTANSHLDIIRAGGCPEDTQPVPQVRPDSEVLLSVSSWHRVRRVFALIDHVEALDIEPCDVAPDYWRHVHNRILGAQPCHTYSLARHRAWLHRCKLFNPGPST